MAGLGARRKIEAKTDQRRPFRTPGREFRPCPGTGILYAARVVSPKPLAASADKAASTVYCAARRAGVGGEDSRAASCKTACPGHEKPNERRPRRGSPKRSTATTSYLFMEGQGSSHNWFFSRAGRSPSLDRLEGQIWNRRWASGSRMSARASRLNSDWPTGAAALRHGEFVGGSDHHEGDGSRAGRNSGSC